MDRCEIVHDNFLRRVAARDFPMGKAPAGPLSPELAVQAFRAACLTRVLDRQSRAMQRAGQGFYTIGSSGHEALAAVALALRPTDMAFLHYRDAAFQIARAGQVPGETPAWDMLLSFASSTDDPISVARDIRAAGAKAGLSVKPGTPIEPYLEILREFDTLLVMSVEPGFGGQKFIAEVLPKVTAVRRLVDAGELTLVVEIDGGINDDTIEAAAAAGVDCFVAGSAVYNAADPGAAVEALRRQAAAASPHLVL